MKKRITALVLMLALLTLAGCGDQQATKTEDKAPDASQALTATGLDEAIPVAAFKGPTAMGMVQLMAENDAMEKKPYQFTLIGAPDEMPSKLLQGDVEIAALPANMASVVYNNSKGQIQVLAINTLGVLYLVENGGETVKSVADLKGKTVYLSGKGATPEYSLNYLLAQNNLEIGRDVTVEFKSEHSEVVAAISQNKDAIGLLPEPFVTVAKQKNPDLRVAVDLNKAWQDSTDGNSLITGVLVVRKAFAEAQPEAVAAFLKDYEASVQYVNQNTSAAATLVGQYDIVTEEVAKAALPQCNITYVAGDAMETQLDNYLKVLHQQNPKVIGGTVPDAAFYFKANA